MHLEGVAILLWAVIMEQVLERYTISAVIYPKFDQLMSIILNSVFVFVFYFLFSVFYFLFFCSSIFVLVARTPLLM